MSSEDTDHKHPDGERPLEEVGPEECGATAPECEFKPGELDGAPEDTQWDPSEEIHEQFEFEPVVAVVDEVDGMPRPADPPGKMPFAPPFTIRHVNCIEDTSEYVEVWLDELEEEDEEEPDEETADGIFAGDSLPSPKWGMPLGHRTCRLISLSPLRVLVRSRWDKEGKERERRRFPTSEVCERFGTLLVSIPRPEEPGPAPPAWAERTYPEEWAPVKPKRERCKFYKRQLFNVDGEDPDEPGGKIQFPNCTKRRSIGGAFMSLQGQAIFACDYRDPPDPESVAEYLDSFDQKRLKERKHRVLIPALGHPGEDINLDDEEP